MILCRACGGLNPAARSACKSCLGGGLEAEISDEELAACWDDTREFFESAGELKRFGIGYLQARHGQIDPVFFEAMSVLMEFGWGE